MSQHTSKNRGSLDTYPRLSNWENRPAEAGKKVKKRVYWEIATEKINPTVEEDENNKVVLHADWTVEIRRKRGRVTETLIFPGTTVKYIYRVEEVLEEEGEGHG